LVIRGLSVNQEFTPFLVDAVSIHEVDVDFDGPLIENGGFEDGFRAWSVPPDRDVSLSSEGMSYRGSKSVLVREGKGISRGPVQSVGVTPGKFYYCQGWVKAAGEDDLSVRIMVKEGGDSPRFQRVTGVSTSRNDWQSVEGAHFVGSRKLDFWIETEGDQASGFWVDEIRLLPLERGQLIRLDP
jgi:hypothetical protein